MADTTPDPEVPNRLYGMMQHLLFHSAQGREPGSAPARNVVNEQDAVDAVVLLAAALEAPAQPGVTAHDRTAFMGALLMVIRDHVRPLPVGESADGSDRATADLKAMVDAIRTSRQSE